jgi:hypothetical protein
VLYPLASSSVYLFRHLQPLLSHGYSTRTCPHVRLPLSDITRKEVDSKLWISGLLFSDVWVGWQMDLN